MKIWVHRLYIATLLGTAGCAGPSGEGADEAFLGYARYRGYADRVDRGDPELLLDEEEGHDAGENQQSRRRFYFNHVGRDRARGPPHRTETTVPPRRAGSSTPTPRPCPS